MFGANSGINGFAARRLTHPKTSGTNPPLLPKENKQIFNVSIMRYIIIGPVGAVRANGSFHKGPATHVKRFLTCLVHASTGCYYYCNFISALWE